MEPLMEGFRKANACSRIIFVEYLEAKKLVWKSPNLVDTYILINYVEEYQWINIPWIVRYMAWEGLIHKELSERFMRARDILFHNNQIGIGISSRV